MSPLLSLCEKARCRKGIVSLTHSRDSRNTMPSQSQLNMHGGVRDLKKARGWPFSPPFIPLCSSPSVTLQLRLVVFPFYQLKWIIQGSLCVPVKCFSSNEHSHRKLRWGEDDQEHVSCRTQAGQLKQMSWHRHARTSIGQWTDPFAFWCISRGQWEASDSEVNMMWLGERLISLLSQLASNKLKNGYIMTNESADDTIKNV